MNDRVEDEMIWVRRMEIALAKADQGIRAGQSPFGAAVFSSDGVLIAAVHNQVRDRRDPTAHAEVVAIRSACRKINRKSLEGFSIVSTCEPCPMCAAAIVFAGIRDVAFGASVEDAKAAGYSLLQAPCGAIFDRAGDEFRIHRDLLRRRCVELFRSAES